MIKKITLPLHQMDSRTPINCNFVFIQHVMYETHQRKATMPATIFDTASNNQLATSMNIFAMLYQNTIRLVGSPANRTAKFLLTKISFPIPDFHNFFLKVCLQFLLSYSRLSFLILDFTHYFQIYQV